MLQIYLYVCITLFSFPKASHCPCHLNGGFKYVDRSLIVLIFTWTCILKHGIDFSYYWYINTKTSILANYKPEVLLSSLITIYVLVQTHWFNELSGLLSARPFICWFRNYNQEAASISSIKISTLWWYWDALISQ